ncbi:hypothetical protein [Rhodococcus sp. BS-15]|uniref:hypothetical protein n=1 Tax=Rhodococcus sp. BS-15 TaxID=1304954 RepID=UPI000AB65548|nr:hypothetical protein [Rhodococcus sp. BS-15]
MTRRTITIEVNIPGSPTGPNSEAASEHDERYADLANSVWMVLQAGSFPFSVTPDAKADTAQLNSR